MRMVLPATRASSLDARPATVARRLLDAAALVLLVGLATALAAALALRSADIHQPVTRGAVRAASPATGTAKPVTGFATVVKRLLAAALVVLLVAVAIALAVAVALRLFGGYGTLVVSGGSMGDSIPNGSFVVARWLDPDDVAIGDVILVTEDVGGSETRPKLHRVVFVEQDADHVSVRTKGDGNTAEDPLLYVLPDRVLTPAYHIPYLGFLVAMVSSPLGWLLLVALPGAALCLLALRFIWLAGPEASPASAQ